MKPFLNGIKEQHLGRKFHLLITLKGIVGSPVVIMIGKRLVKGKVRKGLVFYMRKKLSS